MEKICKYWQLNWKTTPLCNDRELFESLKKISAEKSVPFDIQIWISYAESHIGINYNPDKCYKSNNRAGIKWTVYWDNTKWKRLEHAIPGCWVEWFVSIEEFWMSFTNSMYHGYVKKNCKTAECISKRRVKGDWITSPAWNGRVNIFKY